MCASVQAFFIKIPPNFSVLDIARSHPEMFTTNSSIPLLIQLENEFDGDSTVPESDPAKANNQHQIADLCVAGNFGSLGVSHGDFYFLCKDLSHMFKLT